jgi:hypothetical protein
MVGLAMVAELARVRFFVKALKSGDSSYPKSNPDKALGSLDMTDSHRCFGPCGGERDSITQ